MMILKWCSQSAAWPINYRLPAVKGSHRLLAGGRSRDGWLIYVNLALVKSLPLMVLMQLDIAGAVVTMDAMGCQTNTPMISSNEKPIIC
jgi:hypothetical protein